MFEKLVLVKMTADYLVKEEPGLAKMFNSIGGKFWADPFPTISKLWTKHEAVTSSVTW